MATFRENLILDSEYRFDGFVTGPYKVHASHVILTFRGDFFDAFLDQEGQEITFRVAIDNEQDDCLALKSEPFKLPSNSELSNLEMICTAEMTSSKLTGVLDIPAYSVRLTLDLNRSM